MNQRFRNRPLPAGNPLANLLVVVAGVLTIAVSIVVGFFAFVALAGFVLVFASVIGVRTWWFKRQMAAAATRTGVEEEGAVASSSVIEGEYVVLESSKTRSDRNQHGSQS